MKLKKVEIIGFKSFADKTVIEFHEGITCVVGPNGCGKSNIGDAIRWVLGEQSAKAMRGGKMPDVIFAGASSKKALNFAEVTIVFDEVQGSLPLDYEEIAVTRRLHRSGESEYLLNKQLVRLKDVQSLFLDSGIGKNNISFFEQGKIDQLIQYSPEERRTIFEEAAGIVRFLQRKRETLRKLDEVGLNLTRVDDIKQEVDKQIDLLEDQAATAMVFREKKGQLEIFEKELLVQRYKSYAKKKNDLTVKESESRRIFQEHHEKKELLDQSLAEKSLVHEDLEKKYRVARDAMLTKQAEKDLKAQARVHTEDRIKDLTLRDEKTTREMESLEAKLKEWTGEVKRLESRKENLSHELAECKKTVAQAEGTFQTLDKQLHVLRKKQTDAYRDKVNAFQKQASLQNEVKQLVYRQSTNLEKKEQLEMRSKNLADVIQEKEIELAKRKEVFEASKATLKTSEQHLQSVDENLKEAAAKVQSAQKELGELMKGFHEKSAKLKALLQLRQEFSGFASGGKRLLQESQNELSPLFAKVKGLYEYIIPKAGYESAVSAALKVYAETLVVLTKQDLDTILEFARDKDLSDFSIICLEYLDVAVTESPFIQKDLLGDHLFQGISKQDDWEEAFKSKIASWTTTGWFIDARGVLFVPGLKESSVFMREADIKALEKELEVIANAKEVSEAHLASCFSFEQNLKQERVAADREMRKMEMASVEAGFAVQKAVGDLERVNKEQKQVDDEVKSLLSYVQGVLKEQEKVSDAFKIANSGLDQIQANLVEVEQELASENALAAEKKLALQKALDHLQTVDSEYRKTAHQFHTLDAKVSEAERLQLRLQKERDASRASKEEWLKSAKNTGADLDQILQAVIQTSEETAQLEKLKIASKIAIAEEEKQSKEVFVALKEVENKLHQIGIQLAHVETGQNAVAIEMQDRYQLNVEEYGETLHGISAEKLEKEIRLLKEFLERNQNVNLAAIEECEKQKTRALFLNTQVSDLTEAKLELLKLIAGLDQDSRVLFKTTFDEVRRNFQKNFQILFKGGEADLELLEAEDILEAGIEITAKPPGKQMRSLSLLSGGEKCLTAMALLFAIFEVKSSPFCILDEIDAPLDDSNVERFLNVVKQFIDRCQFIIVTHNKRTMALADRLYGVSMEEKGISKLLFMEFSGKSTQTIGV